MQHKRLTHAFTFWFTNFASQMFFYIIFLKCQSSDYPVRYISTILKFKLIYCDFNLKCILVQPREKLGQEMFLRRWPSLSDTRSKWSILTYVKHPTAIYKLSEWESLTQMFGKPVNGLLRLSGDKRKINALKTILKKIIWNYALPSSHSHKH